MPDFTFAIVLILIIVISAIVGLKRGFVRSIAGLASYIISYIVANRFYTLLTPIVSKIPFIQSMTTDIEMPEIESGAGFLGKIGAIFKYLFDNAMSNPGSDVTETARAVINNFLAELITEAIAFLALFFGALIVLKLILFLIDKFCETPVLKGTNKTLGVIFGILCGFFITWILSNLFVNTLLPIFVERWPAVFSYELGEHFMVKFFMKFSPVALVMYFVNKIGSIGAGT